MKKIITIFITIIVIVSFSAVSVNAEETMIYDMSEIYENISPETKKSLEKLGIDSVDYNKLSQLSFSSIIDEISNIATDNISAPLKGLVTIISLILLSSILYSYKNTLSDTSSTVLNITTVLCITSAVAISAIDMIKVTSTVIDSASKLMLAYIPIMVVIMSTAGQGVSGGSYYSMMIVAGEGIGQLSSKVIVPFLNMFLGLSITSSVSPDINLSGFINIISKTIKWLLVFGMTIFTALLSIKQLLTSSLDTVSSRAIKFTLNSFVPIVGSALADAYKTVQGSVGILKTGLGVFVIIAVAVVFLPVIIQTIMWIITLWIGKVTAEVLNLNQTAKLLESVSTVFSTLLAILLCIMSVYIISTAIVLIAGGGVS